MQGKFFGGFVLATARTSAVAAILFTAAVFAPLANAQISSGGPQFLMTWSASNSYAPAGYAGKILPNQTSQITASFDLIANGRPVNLSGQTVYWYQNDNLMGGGVGDQKVTFRPYGTAPNTIALKIELPDYPGGMLIHEIDIPIVQPLAVIEVPYAQGDFTTSPAMIQALPYFFATTSTSPLDFGWLVNGQAVTSAENPQLLQISLPQNTPANFAVAVTLTVQNSNDSTNATANANLTYQ